MEVPATITLPAGANGHHNQHDAVYPDEVSNLIGDNANAADAYHTAMAQKAAAAESLKHKPMDHLVVARRRNLCWSVSLLIFFLGLIASLAVWRFQQQSSTGDTGFVSSSSGRAAHAREVLNKHFHSQSKVIQPGCEATILLMRHCEKHGPNVKDEDGNEHCSYVGMQRAQFLPTLFDPPRNKTTATAATHKRWPMPSFLFALSPDRDTHWNFRQYETLRPLSQQSQIDIELIKSKELPPKLFGLLQSGALCGKMAAVSWKHEYLPDLAIALGCGQDQGCPAVYPEYSFDQVWQLKYVFSPPSPLYDKTDESKLQGGQTWGKDQSSTLIDDNQAKEESTTDREDNDVPAEDSVDDDDATRRHLQRALRHQKKKRKANEGWFVFGSVQRMGFDPLSFSNIVGDYPPGGAASAGKWKDEI